MKRTVTLVTLLVLVLTVVALPLMAQGARKKEGEVVMKVGEVKVLRLVGQHYFEGQITKGKVKVGDIVKKEKTGMLVQPAE
ncbi:hypothetical protein GMSM_39150 [Geomonas sp. Red276]